MAGRENELNNPYGKFEVYEPQLVHKAPDNGFDSELYNQPIIASYKKDGAYYRLCKYENKVYLFSRTVSKKTGYYAEKIDNVPWLKEWAAKYLPNDSCIIGEIYYPGESSKDVVSIMGCLPEKAQERQDTKGNIHFYIHDILQYAGYDYVKNGVEFKKRFYDVVRKIFEGTPHPNELELATYMDTTEKYDLEEFLYNALSAGEEGVVFRSASGLYLPGKRNKTMWKVKEHIDSLDFVIRELLKPEKEYTGKCPESWPYWIADDFGNEMPVTKDYYDGVYNALSIGLYDSDGKLVPIGRVSSGITDEMKVDMRDNPEKYLGKVCSISCMSVDKEKKTLRHPCFESTHCEKNAYECTIQSVFDI